MSQGLAGYRVVYGDPKDDEYQEDSGDERFADANRKFAYGRTKRQRLDAAAAAMQFGSDPLAGFPDSADWQAQYLAEQAIENELDGILEDLKETAQAAQQNVPDADDEGDEAGHGATPPPAGPPPQSQPEQHREPPPSSFPAPLASVSTTPRRPGAPPSPPGFMQEREPATGPSSRAALARPPGPARPSSARNSKLADMPEPSLSFSARVEAGGITIDEDLLQAAKNRGTTAKARVKSPAGGNSRKKNSRTFLRSPVGSTAPADRTPVSATVRGVAAANPISKLLCGSTGGRTQNTPRGARGRPPSSRFRQPQLETPGAGTSRFARSQHQRHHTVVADDVAMDAVENASDDEMQSQGAALEIAHHNTDQPYHHQQQQQQQQEARRTGLPSTPLDARIDGNADATPASPATALMHFERVGGSGEGCAASSLQRHFLAGLAPPPARAPLPINARGRFGGGSGGLYGRMQTVLAVERAAMDHPPPPSANTWIHLMVMARNQDVGIVQAHCRVESVEWRTIVSEVVILLGAKAREGVDVAPGVVLKAAPPWKVENNPIIGAPPLLLCRGVVVN